MGYAVTACSFGANCGRIISYAIPLARLGDRNRIGGCRAVVFAASESLHRPDARTFVPESGDRLICQMI
ncbi:MAG: hypothetical protein R2941_01135 [Desulfobacterales bacterium]